MGTIRLQGISKQYGGQVVLDGIDLELHSGRTVGLVGPNGAGKTTLLRLILGQEQPEMGTVTRSRDVRVGYLPQEPEIAEDKTLHDEVISVFDEVFELETRMHDLSERMAQASGSELDTLMTDYDRVNEQFIAAGGYEYETRLREVLGGLGFTEGEMSRPVSVLSGGQKCRAALARLLLQDSTYLLLDEPTNHLDIDAVRWLERYLASHHGGAAIISHDRYLLDRTVDGIIEVDRRQVAYFPGNYTNYVKTSQLRALTQDREYARDQAFIEKERAFIAKHLAGQRTREAQGRRARLERRIAAGEFTLEKTSQKKELRFQFDVEVPQGRYLIEAEGLRKGYEDLPLFSEVRLAISGGQRIGITGPNGTGKSTLLKVLVGEIEADDGSVRIDAKAQVGYFAQDGRELDPDSNVLASILDVRPDFSEERARGLLGRFQFGGEAAFKRVGTLSGGEQSRVRLLRLLLKNPNVLILDEPTNHLDIPSREALEAALGDYPGTILAVSHDRYFLDRVADELLVMRSGGHQHFRGNYTRYVEQLERTRASAGEEAASGKPARAAKTGRKKGPARTGGAPRSEYDRMDLEALEQLIMEHEEQLANCHAQFARSDVVKDKDALAAVQDEVARLESVLAEASAAWERKAE